MLFNSTKAIVFFALIDSNLFNKQVLYTTLQYYLHNPLSPYHYA